MRSFGLVALPLSLSVLILGCLDQKVTRRNNAPEASINSHESGDVAYEGFVETFRGSASDSDDAISDLVAVWFYGDAEICTGIPDSDGTTECLITIGLEDSQVLLEVRDPEGAAHSDSVSLEVIPTETPDVSIVQPESTGVFYSDRLVTFEGVVTDNEDIPSDLFVWWESSLGDDLSDVDASPNADGEFTGFGYLTEGEHALELFAEDLSAKTGSDSVIIVVGPPNTAPDCEITAPEMGAAGPEGELVIFEGLVSDVDVSADWLSVEWSSDKDGDLGPSTPNSSGGVTFPYSSLTVNTHVVSMTVTDEVGATCTVDVVYTVGTPPVLTIDAPVSGDLFHEDESVTFLATVLDNEDLPSVIALEWTSDVDGQLSTQGADSSGQATFVLTGLSLGAHILTVTATDSDGLYALELASFTINGLPGEPTVTLSPDPATTEDDLVSTATGSTDAEGSMITYGYTWYLGGQLSTTSTSATLPASATAKDEAWSVVVTPTDSDGGVGATGTASLTISNTAPVLGAVTVTPSSGITSSETLVCSATAIDVDGETPSITYSWTNNSSGDALGTDSSLVLSLATVSPGDSVTCAATATDGSGDTDQGSATVVVDNTDPTVDSVSISPDSGVRIQSTLTCSATASDDDGDTPTLSYAWTNGSTSLGSGDTLALTSATSSPGDSITCSVTATDSDGGSGTGSASVTVENTEPIVDSVSVTPSSGVKITSTLTCSATASDEDGDTPTLSYAWTNDTDSSSLGTGNSLALSTSTASKGDSISCTATATDSDGGTDSDSDAVSIENSTPSMSSVSVSPASPSVSDTLTCTYAGFSDADGDSDQSTYAWTIGVGTVGTSSTLAGVFVAGNIVACAVTHNDGEDTGTADTDSVTIQNTAPEIGSVSLSPTTVYTDDTITASVSTFDDDGDSVSVSYAWYVGGSQVAETGSSLDGGSYFDKGEEVYVVVTPSDGTDSGTDSGTAVTSSPITVSNTAPGAPGISIDPEEPTAGSDDLICLIDTESSDDDQDTITYSFDWDVNGSTWTGSTYTTYETDDTIDGADTSAGEEWTCTAVASDGMDSSAANASASASVTIGTECADTLTDIDGNTYSTVEIGSQCWMASNLNTTHDANGASISRWCCDCNQYGGMYDWSAVMNGSSTDGAQGICPDGWHVPSDADWFLLESYIDPSMTNPNYIGWSNTTIADQLYLGGSYGFDWLTGGFSYGGNGCSYNFDRIGYWTSSNYSAADAISRFFNTAFSGINRDLRGKGLGYYVRCLQD